MGYNIRPLSFGEVLDRAFVVLRDHFWLIVGISAVVWIPFGVLEIFAQIAYGPLARAVFATIGGLLMIIGAAVLFVAVTAAVANAYVDRPVTVRAAYRSTGRILARAVGTYLLQLLFFALCCGAIMLIFFMVPNLLQTALIAISTFIALGGVCYYFRICWLLLAPVMIVETRFGIAALRRSRELVRGAWWRTLGIYVISATIAFLPAAALNLFWSQIPFLGPFLDAGTLAVTSTYGVVVLVVYYFDRRCRTEDFDLRLLAEQIRSEAETGTQPMPGASPVG